MSMPLSDHVLMLESEIQEIQGTLTELNRHDPTSRIKLSPHVVRALWQHQLDDAIDHWEALTGRSWADRTEP